MNPIETLELTCPWCGASILIRVDVSAGSHEAVEDCEVCCAPILVAVDLDASDDTGPRVRLEREGG